MGAFFSSICGTGAGLTHSDGSAWCASSSAMSLPPTLRQPGHTMLEINHHVEVRLRHSALRRINAMTHEAIDAHLASGWTMVERAVVDAMTSTVASGGGCCIAAATVNA